MVGTGKGSIFAQQIKKMKKDNADSTQDEPMEVDGENVIKEVQEFKTFVSKKQNLPVKSYILTGSESDHIHEENLNVIRNMTEEEITEEREKLISTMDPAIIAYLKSKRKKEIIKNDIPTIKEQNEAAEDVKIEEIDTACEILGQNHAEKWLNFNVVEANKLAWMKNFDIPKLKKSDNFEAR